MHADAASKTGLAALGRGLRDRAAPHLAAAADIDCRQAERIRKLGLTGASDVVSAAAR